MSERQVVPSTVSSVLTIAALTWKRMIRGRALWVSLAIAVLPILYAAATRDRVRFFGGPQELFGFETLILTVLPPMFVASSIGEEIEDRTITYLWSRPVPRWAVLAGKLAALVPVVIALSLASWVVTLAVRSEMASVTVSTCGALVAGATTISLIAAGISTLSPKHGMALTICFLWFVDLPLGVLPAKLQELSVSHQIRVLSGMFAGAEDGAPGIALSVLALAWIAIAASRIRKLEA